MRNAGLSKSAENRWETADDVADEELGKTNKIYTVKTDLLKTKLRTPPSQIPSPTGSSSAGEAEHENERAEPGVADFRPNKLYEYYAPILCLTNISFEWYGSECSDR